MSLVGVAYVELVIPAAQLAQDLKIVCDVRKVFLRIVQATGQRGKDDLSRVPRSSVSRVRAVLAVRLRVTVERPCHAAGRYTVN